MYLENYYCLLWFDQMFQAPVNRARNANFSYPFSTGRYANLKTLVSSFPVQFFRGIGLVRSDRIYAFQTLLEFHYIYSGLYM